MRVQVLPVMCFTKDDMYFYIFQDRKFRDEVFTNVRDRGLLAIEMQTLMDKNRMNDTQIIMSNRRFINPKLIDEGIKEE